MNIISLLSCHAFLSGGSDRSLFNTTNTIEDLHFAVLVRSRLHSYWLVASSPRLPSRHPCVGET